MESGYADQVSFDSLLYILPSLLHYIRNNFDSNLIILKVLTILIIMCLYHRSYIVNIKAKEAIRKLSN